MEGPEGGLMKIHLHKAQAKPGTRRKRSRSRPSVPESIHAQLESARFGNVVEQTLGSEEASTSYGAIDERSIWLRQALRRLPEPEDRQIMAMRFFVGMTLAEIVIEIGLPEPEVRERYRRSLRLLDRELRGRF